MNERYHMTVRECSRTVHEETFATVADYTKAAKAWQKGAPRRVITCRAVSTREECWRAEMSNETMTTEQQQPLIFADYIDGQYVAYDDAGGIWWPDDDARAEIERSSDPEARVREIAATQPMRGTWKD